MLLRNFLKIKKPFLSFQRFYQPSGALPPLTQDHSHVKRSNYNVVTDKDLSYFEKLLGSNYVLQEDLQGYNVDFLRRVRGDSKVVLKPGSVEELSLILKYCNDNKIAVCPQGGNTGLVGGSVPVFDEVVLSMNRFNKIINIDEMTGIAVCESGCILENVDNEAREKGFLFPLDLGAKASCHVGGNVSTNAGGLRVLRYGNLHGSVLGVEAVLANGKVIDLMSNFKKDNTGYHLKHLFIGSEGTLGILTKLSVLCPPAPSSVHLAFLGLNSFDDVLQTFKNSKRFLGEILSSCEMMDAGALGAAIKHFNLQSPIADFPFYMLIETSGSNEDHDMEKFNKFLEHGMENGVIQDGTVTGTLSKMQEIWKLREMIPVGLVQDGFCFKYDISLPLRDFYNIVNVMQERCGHLAERVCGYGHLGDSNLHLNICNNEYTEELYKKVEPFVYEFTAQTKGSISAEHGIGFLKTDYLKYSKSPEAIDMMIQMKNLLDPNKILNPYKVLH